MDQRDHQVLEDVNQLMCFLMGSAAVVLPEDDGRCTDTSELERQEERRWRRRRVPEDAEEEDKQSTFNTTRKGKHQEPSKG